MSNIDAASAAYGGLYDRYMAALSVQYLAFRLMVTSDANHREMFIAGVLINSVSSSVTLRFGELKPSDAYEAWMFAPPGYWKTVNNNDRFPDDFPLNLMPSISGDGASLVVKTDVIDGDYEYFYYIDDICKRLCVTVVSGKLTTVNAHDVSGFTDNIEYTVADVDALSVDIDVNASTSSFMDAELVIAQLEAAELDADVVVCRWGSSSLDTSILVTHFADLDCEVNVGGHLDLSADILVQRVDELDLLADILVKRVEVDDLDASVTVGRTEAVDLDADCLVYSAADLPADILVQQAAGVDLDAVVNVQRVDQADLNCELTVKRTGVAPDLDVEFVIARDGSASLDAEVSVVGQLTADLDVDLEVPLGSAASSLETSIAIANQAEAELAASVDVSGESELSAVTQLDLTVVNDSASLEAEVNVQRSTMVDLSADLVVANDAGLSVIADGWSAAVGDLDADLVVTYGGLVDLDVDLVVAAEAELLVNVDESRSTSVSQLDVDLVVAQLTTADLDCSIAVGDESALSVSAELTRTPFTGTTSIDAELEVGYVDVVDLDCSIAVVRDAFAEVTTFTVAAQADDLPAELTVAHELTVDLDVDVVVTAAGQLEATTQLINGGVLDLDAEVLVHDEYSSSIDVDVLVTASGLVAVNSDVNNAVFADLDAEVAVAVNAELDAEVYVERADAPVLEASDVGLPRVTTRRSLTTVKDAEVYSITPLTNYGAYQDLVVKNAKSNAVIQTLVGFDLSSLGVVDDGSSAYFNYQTVSKATLRLFCTAPAVEKVTVSVYAVDDNWYERSVNFRAASTLTRYAKVATFVAPTNGGWLDVNVLNDFVDFERSPRVKRSYVLAVDQRQLTNTGVTFAAREYANGAYAPRLNLDYTRTLPHGGWVDLDAEVEVKPYVDLGVDLDVVAPSETFLTADLEVAVAGSNEAELEVSIDVNNITVVRNDLPADVEVIGYPGDSSVAADVFVNFTPASTSIDAELEVLRDANAEARVFII